MTGTVKKIFDVSHAAGSRGLRAARKPPEGGTPNATRSGFTLVELIVVMGIIVLLVSFSIPAIRAVNKSNDESQASNLVRAAIGSARAIAIAQHRMAGVVFFEETSTFSSPVNTGQTAMQLFIEDFNQNQYGPLAGVTCFVKYTSGRQYLPTGMKIAALTDNALTGNNIETGDSASPSTGTARAILFDSNGQLLTRVGLATADPAGPPVVAAGVYPKAYGDWKFGKPAGPLYVSGIAVAASYPGFFIYRKDEYDAQPVGVGRLVWLKQHSSVILVNVNTGNVLVDRGPGQ